MISMPDHTFNGTLPPPTADEILIKTNLTQHVEHIAGEIGERNVIIYDALQKTARYIEDSFNRQGYKVTSQEYTVQMRKVRNLIAEIPGETRQGEIVVIGAHYDSVYECPGADDNASGVAALLELARILKDSHPARTLRLVAFVNEEPPWFRTNNMGSLVYADAVHARKENIVAAISLETIGTYSDVEGSQQYPDGFKSFYPSKGNFIAFVGDLSSRRLVRDSIRSFRKVEPFPSEGSSAPGWILGVGWSDHWSFWQAGYQAIMVTDTAPFRNDNYHQRTDTADTLDYERMARVVHGLAAVVTDLGK
jgi:Zn-dependent M28 family amino/carboxypeptidase